MKNLDPKAIPLKFSLFTQIKKSRVSYAAIHNNQNCHNQQAYQPHLQRHPKTVEKNVSILFGFSPSGTREYLVIGAKEQYL